MKKFVSFFLIALLLAGCTQQAEVPSSLPTTLPAVTAPQEVPLLLYLPDENVESWVTEEVSIPELSARYILESLIAYGVLADGIAINQFSQEGSHLAVDWNEAFASFVSSMGTAGEYITFGGVVNTFLTAYGAESITMTVEGNVIETGHSIYDNPLSFYE